MSRHTVIIADDHSLVGEGLSQLLANRFDVVAVVNNGRALLDAVSRRAPDFICLDIAMPEMNGLRAAQQLSSSHPRVKLIFVTQQLELPYLRAAFRAGARGYVAKQSAAAELLTAIARVLDGGTYVTPVLAEAAAEMQHELFHDPTQVFTDQLTQRQREVLTLLAEGMTAKQIASTLGISVKTVEFHKAGLMNDLGLRTVAELTRYAVRHNLILP